MKARTQGKTVAATQPVFDFLTTFNDQIENLNINLAFLSVCLYPINVKTAEPIGPKFFVGHLGTPGKVYE